MLLASAVPLTVGVESLVRSSAFDVPESLAASRSGVAGAAGAAVSMTTTVAAEAALTLPAASVAVAVMLCEPSASVPAVKVQVPAPFAVVVPSRTAPS